MSVTESWRNKINNGFQNSKDICTLLFGNECMKDVNRKFVC